jgi:hypothetical protein
MTDVGMTTFEQYEAVKELRDKLRSRIRTVMLELAEARQTKDTDGILALREELVELFEDRDRKEHALDRLMSLLQNGG